MQFQQINVLNLVYLLYYYMTYIIWNIIYDFDLFIFWLQRADLRLLLQRTVYNRLTFVSPT